MHLNVSSLSSVGVISLQEVTDKCLCTLFKPELKNALTGPHMLLSASFFFVLVSSSFISSVSS